MPGASSSAQVFAKGGRTCLANLALVDHIDLKRSSTLRMTTTKQCDNLNQSTSLHLPNDVGVATPGATVTFNGAATCRKGPYFQRAHTSSNGSGPAYIKAIVVAVGGGVTNTVTGVTFVSPAAEAYTYDADGNLLTDGRNTYSWDGENRMLVSDGNSNVPTAVRFRAENEYDYKGRRIRKKGYTWSGSAWVLATDTKYLYDGWNVIAELDGSNALVRSYIWGLDLRGSLQGAGGVGGLVAIKPASANAHFHVYDGNGNVMALVDATTGGTTTYYDYGPFGEGIRSSGTLATTNPFRFSTKYQDNETDFYYYGYRFYNASTGRWLSKDPIGERGGGNLYSYVNNRAPQGVDVLGLCKAGEKRGAKCEAVVKHYATTPGYDEAVDDFYKFVQNVDNAADLAELVLGMHGAAKAEIIEAVGAFLLDKNMKEIGADDVYAAAQRAAEEGHGAFGGFKLWTRIRYEECGKCFFGLASKWKEKESDWKQFAKRTANNNNDFIYEIKLGGHADADEACEAHLAEFNK